MFKRKHFFYEAPIDGGGGEPNPNPNPAPVMITQEKANSLLAEQKRASKANLSKVTAELETLKNHVSLTTEEKTALQLRIDEINAESLSKEELAKKKADEIAKKTQAEHLQLTEEAKNWKSKFFNAEIAKEIAIRSEEEGALHSSQIADLISHKIEVKTDDKGNSTFVINNGEKDLSIAEHIKSMRENVDSYGNLFKTDKTSGTGSQAPSANSNLSNFDNMSVGEILESRRLARTK